MCGTGMRAAFILVCLAWILVSAGPAVGGGIIANQSLSVQTAYDSNVDFDGESDLVTDISPRLDLQGQLGRGFWTLGGGFNYKTHQEQSDKDRTNRDLSVGYSYGFSERTSAALQSSFQVDHVTESELEEFGEVIRPTRRMTFSLAPQVSHTIDELNSVQAGASYSRSYSEAEDVADRTSYGGSASWSRRLDEVNNIVLSANYQTSESVLEDRTTFFDAYSLTVGYRYTVTEVIDFSFNIGPSRSKSRDEFNNGFETDETTNSYTLSGGLSWRRERDNILLRFSRDQSQTSEGEATTRYGLNGTYSYSWTERLSSSLGIGYTRSDKNEEDDDTQSLRIAPSMSYKLTENIGLTVRYQYQTRDSDDEEGWQNRNQMSVQFTQSFEKLFD